MKSLLLSVVFIITLSKLEAQHMELTEDRIMQILSRAKMYTFAYLVDGINRKEAETDSLIAQQVQMEHLKYLFTLKEEGKLCIFGPLVDEGEIHGILFFNTDRKADVIKMLDNDPQVKRGWTSYKLNTYFGLPGDSLH